MDDSIRLYEVIETRDMSAEELQDILNKATDDLPERQIDHVLGTKIILGRDSMLNAKGRADARLTRNTLNNLDSLVSVASSAAR